MAVAEPTGLQVPDDGLEQICEMAARLGPSTAEGSVSATERGLAWPAPWVMSVVIWTWWSALSRAAVTLKPGENGSDPQPVTVSGALTVRTVGSPYELDATTTLAGVAGQLEGNRRPSKVPLISVTEIEVAAPSTVYVSGMLENRMSSPKPAGSLAGRMTTSAGDPSCW